MGEYVDRLVALSGVEHVKSYTKKDGTHVSAHTREGDGKVTFPVHARYNFKPGKASTGHVPTPLGHGAPKLIEKPAAPVGHQDNVPYDPSDSSHPKPQFKVGQTVVKGNGKKLWIVRDARMTQYANGSKHWQYAVKNYDTGKSGSLWHGEKELNPAHEGADAQAQGEAVKALNAKLAQHKASFEAKDAQKPSQSQSKPLEGKVVKYSTKRPNPKHPKPIESDTIDGRNVVDRRLKQLADGTFRWEYLLGKTDTLKAEWVAK